MLSLANECVCCEIRDNLIEAVDRLMTRDPPPEFVVIEASGVADPASIYATFARSEPRERIRLDSVTCVVAGNRNSPHSPAAAAPEILAPQLVARVSGGTRAAQTA